MAFLLLLGNAMSSSLACSSCQIIVLFGALVCLVVLC